MKTLEVKLFSFDELSDEAKARAIQDQQNNAATYELTCYDEMRDTLKSICNACNVRLMDYSYGPSDRNHKVIIRNYDLEDEHGPRALAWFLKILINHGYTRPKKFAEMQFPGICGFTGVCYDDDAVETIWNALLDGDTVSQAFDAISGRFCEIAEKEYEYQTSEEASRDYLTDNGGEEIFTEEGENYRF